MSKIRVAVLISGRGSNMAALLAAAAAPDYPAEIVLVLSNRPEAAGLLKAAAADIPAAVVDHKDFASRADFEAALDVRLVETGIQLVCLAGFMRLFTPWFIERWRDRLLNIHPSLLPAFRGLRTHERVLEAGARVTGCTVHLVRAEMDEGPIIAQAAVPVLAEDTPESLAARVLETEHRLYPHALGLLASGAARVAGDRVVIPDEPPPAAPLFSPALRAEPH
ncbi:MAG: phosphoribosylglycinamide formyltransferase [Pseudomonadota bacterium]|nr:phosphoribosylglycinamide formyltransferase [Pseudomonadota bacterium]